MAFISFFEGFFIALLSITRAIFESLLGPASLFNIQEQYLWVAAFAMFVYWWTL